MSSFLSPQFVIGSIRIGTVEGASCVNLGNNFPTNFTNNQKINQGIGNITGDHNSFRDTKSVVEDSDILDMMNEAGGELPGWVKEMMVEGNPSSS